MASQEVNPLHMTVICSIDLKDSDLTWWDAVAARAPLHGSALLL